MIYATSIQSQKHSGDAHIHVYMFCIVFYYKKTVIRLSTKVNILQSSEVVTRRVLEKRCSYKIFRKIHRKTPVPESLF